MGLQHAIRQGKITCTKVPRSQNPADMLTHHWNTADGIRHMQSLGLCGVADGEEEIKVSTSVHGKQRAQGSIAMRAHEAPAINE